MEEAEQGGGWLEELLRGIGREEEAKSKGFVQCRAGISISCALGLFTKIPVSPITAEVERTGCGSNRHSRKEQGWKTPCPFYLEGFGSFKSLFHPLEHPHVSRHSQHLSLPSSASLRLRGYPRRPGAEREAPKKRSPAPINRLIPTKRLWSRAQPRARESCQREGKEGEREEARAVPAGAD